MGDCRLYTIISCTDRRPNHACCGPHLVYIDHRGGIHTWAYQQRHASIFVWSTCSDVTKRIGYDEPLSSSTLRSSVSVLNKTLARCDSDVPGIASLPVTYYRSGFFVLDVIL